MPLKSIDKQISRFHIHSKNKDLNPKVASCIYIQRCIYNKGPNLKQLLFVYLEVWFRVSLLVESLTVLPYHIVAKMSLFVLNGCNQMQF